MILLSVTKAAFSFTLKVFSRQKRKTNVLEVSKPSFCQVFVLLVRFSVDRRIRERKE